MNALLIMAHGSPRPEANEDIRNVASLVKNESDYPFVTIGYLDCNEPDIATAIDDCVSAGATSIAAVPYFLHSGRHLLRDVPAILKEGALRHPSVTILMGDYVGHEPQIAEVLLDRVRAAG
ncbi:MAG TPA: CbiX/SirB N-terminal domain-containing protein [Thermoanaerobaculia bacterium]|nr:CbiX/SirB N-terminal domain-containing protein [Thermoanaerobaculia bacterium]